MKHILVILGIGSIALLLIVVLIIITIAWNTRRYLYTDITPVPHAQVALIPGAGILRNSTPSAVLRDRIDKAIELYRAGNVKKILVTGSNSTLEYNEVAPIRNYLLKKGIPDGDIVSDYAGFDTYSSMYRARDVFQVRSMIVVSQSFHLPRAVFIARHLGITAYGVSADNGHYLFTNYLHEIVADCKAVFNLLVKRQPKYLGPVIPAGGQ